ncbi:MAG: hypothetical protein JW917_03980 [Ignavibacteria bacterium]|nr:hypothetical protein [Ignavibacteria bacterium]
MSKVIFEIKYSVKGDKKDEYLSVVASLKESISNHFNIQYFVLRNKKPDNVFSELFIFEDEEQFDSFEDNQPEEIQNIMNRLYDEFIENGSISYITKYEI